MGLNTYPSNPFPPSTDRMDADVLEAEVSKLNNDVSELKSGLTNYELQNNTNLEVPNRKNLIDSNAYSNGYFTSEGALTENQYYYATDYMKVEPNTDYVVSGFVGGGAYFVFYNASKTVLSTIVDTTTTFKTPANTAFVRLSIKRDGMTNPQMELGSTASAYTAYIPSVETRLESVESSTANLATSDLLYDGYPASVDTFEQKDLASGKNLSNYLFLNVVCKHYENTRLTVIEPMHVFTTQNADSKRIVMKDADVNSTEVYYVSPTKIAVKQHVVDNGAFHTAVYGVLKKS